MPKFTYLKQQDWNNSEKVLQALSGAQGQGMSALQYVERNMQTALFQNFNQVLKPRFEFPPVWSQIRYNNIVLKNYDKQIVRIIQQMDLGSRLIATAKATDVDGQSLIDIVNKFMQLLRMVSPIDTGLYVSQHRVWIDGKPVSTTRLKNITEASYAWIFNPLDYASTHETRRYSQPYQKALRRAARSFGKNWDMLLEFLNPNALGGQVSRKMPMQSIRPKVYTIPVVIIAPLNSLPRTGFYWRKRRGMKRKPVTPR